MRDYRMVTRFGGLLGAADLAIGIFAHSLPAACFGVAVFLTWALIRLEEHDAE